MSLAVVFPGQGSQRVGMCQDWMDVPAVAQTFAEADAALGFPLSELCFNGPEEQLRLTSNQQPAILTASIAIWRALQGQLPEVACMAGHSLGEYSGLVASGALDFADAVRIVNRRGELMQEAVPQGTGAMAAVIGMEAEQIRSIDAEVRKSLPGRVLAEANFNSPEQTVVSGHADAVHAAMEQYSSAGAKRVVELPVSAPFHCELMTPAADALKPMLDGTAFATTELPVVANLTVQPYPTDPMQYAMHLHAQIFNPVRWTDTIAWFAASGVTDLLEIGPGKVLRMLTVKTNRDIRTYNVDARSDAEGLAAWLEELS
ncbi:MAG: ACP S-malonyltransferase [Planctomycetales bacterium]|nr:ACP S-malonyltransferase [bacterium]UNM09836.1 MAG: ACP S-malonyltransferase [Planctomycetales bacterium]